MTNLQKILTSHFGNINVDVVKPEKSEPGVTRQQLGEMLGYENPFRSIANIHNRYKNRLDSLSTVIKMVTVDGKERDVYVYGFKGVLEICRYSDQPLADAVIDWAWDTLDKLRRGELTPSQQIQRLESELEIYRQKIQIFEEYNEDFLYDLDQVAGIVRQYRQPPFGQKHLKHWLEKRGVLCNAHFKNDKPIQRYIENGWFKAVVSEWKRRGRRRYETRWLVTQRGLNGIVDLAIRENMLTLPALKQHCLFDLFEDPLPAIAGGPIVVSDHMGDDVVIQ